MRIELRLFLPDGSMLCPDAFYTLEEQVEGLTRRQMEGLGQVLPRLHAQAAAGRILARDGQEYDAAMDRERRAVGVADRSIPAAGGCL